MTDIITNQIGKPLIEHGIQSDIKVNLPDFPDSPEECHQKKDSNQDGCSFKPDTIHVKNHEGSKHYQSYRQAGDKMGQLVIQGKYRWPVPIHDATRNMYEDGERYHEFYPKRERDPQQPLNSIGNQRNEKWPNRYLHPWDIIDIPCMNSQCDKTYLKKDNNNILDCSRVDRKSPALFYKFNVLNC